MAVVFVDGMDKYGPAGQTTPTANSLLLAGEWTTLTGTHSIVAGLSSTGQALSVASNNSVGKGLGVNYTRLIGGFRFSSSLGASSGPQFYDSATVKCSLTINASTGTISLRTGAANGTALATSATTVSANSTHYLEWDITFAASGAYQVWLDGVSVFSGTGNTFNSGNSYANLFYFNNPTGGTLIADDLYLFDSSGTTNNAVLLNNPIVETAFPSSDSAKAWTNSASIIGVNNSATGTGTVSSTGIKLRAYTAPSAMTLQSISLLPAATSGAANLRAVVYASATTGAALLASGPTVTGATSGATLTLPLTTPLALTGGTTYAIGFMADTSFSIQASDGASQGYTATATFGSGAPATLPTVTSGAASTQIWGNCTGSSADWPNLAMNPSVDDAAYLSSSTVGQQEMQGFPVLASTPSAVACVAYKARIKRSDAGNRNIEVHCVSGAADSAGSTAGGVTPGSSYAWIGGYFPLDPQSGVAWTGSGVNGASGGVKVVT